LADLVANLRTLRTQIPENVSIVAVSKTRTCAEILELYQAGLLIFGENKVQELVQKRTDLPDDIQWHFIGHLQRNKVKYIAPFISLIQSVDSMPLMVEINSEAGKNSRVIDCLLQFHIATEETKYGLDLEEAVKILQKWRDHSMPNIRVTGVMGMASFTDDFSLVRQEFRQLRNYFQLLQQEFFRESSYFQHISMGMSGDYTIAIEEGSTMVRIGTTLFGERVYL
jgi:pyridoxal phosphate enzyme (YggS family)